MPISSNIRILLSILFLILISISSTYSQSSSDLDSLEGKFALQFQISEDFTLTNFQGTTFSGKYHFSSRDAVRLGFTFELSDSEIKADVTHLDTTDSDQSKDNINRFGFTINSQYIHYFTVTDNIAFFGGAGPFISFFDQNSERVITENGTEINRKISRSGYTAGLDLITGVEWWFHEQMSLSAEYGLKFNYTNSEDKFNDDVIEGESEINSFHIIGNTVKFGISVYF